MAFLSDKALEEYKKIFKDKYKREISGKEAREGAQNLLSFFETLYSIAEREAIRTKRLEKEPKGFHLEENGGQYNCIICHRSVSGKGGWWDSNGIKCMDCQRNLNKKVIPVQVCKNRDSWFATWELQDKFGIHPSSVRKLVREGKLKVRNLANEGGGIYYQVFLLKENKNYLASLKK